MSPSCDTSPIGQPVQGAVCDWWLETARQVQQPQSQRSFQRWQYSWRESSRGSWDDCYKSCKINHNSRFNREKKKYLCTRDCGPFCPPGVKGVFLWVSLRVRLASGGLVAQYAKTFCQNPGEHFCLLYLIHVKGFRWFAGAGAKGFSAWRVKLLVRGKKPTTLPASLQPFLLQRLWLMAMGF